jgi:hypothetical protein
MRNNWEFFFTTQARATFKAKFIKMLLKYDLKSLRQFQSLSF